MEGKDGILSISIVHGFPYADVPENTSRVLVIADGDKARADRLATSIGEELVSMRGKTMPHPRSYGTFPRLLGRYVREQHVISLEEAVHKMTAMNADKLSITNRGRIQVGLAADITLFDPDKVEDKATFVQPHQFPVGIPYVIVNGQVVLDNGVHTGALPGRVLRGPGYVRN